VAVSNSGEGREREALQLQIEELGLTDSVLMPGVVKHQSNGCSMRRSSFSRHALKASQRAVEAMQCGLPVVAFDCPSGPGEIVRHEQTGLLVPAGEADALAAAIARLATDLTSPTARSAAAADVASRFSLQHVCAMWEELLVSVAGGPNDVTHPIRTRAWSRPVCLRAQLDLVPGRGGRAAVAPQSRRFVTFSRLSHWLDAPSWTSLRQRSVVAGSTTARGQSAFVRFRHDSVSALASQGRFRPTMLTGALSTVRRSTQLIRKSREMGCRLLLGVLHHTGAMWNASQPLSDRSPGRRARLAIYNDQGFQSRIWQVIKRAYVKVPALRPLLVAASAPALWGPSLVKAALKLQLVNGGLATSWSAACRAARPADWVGVTVRSGVGEFHRTLLFGRGFVLENAITTSKLGCNQFSLRRRNVPDTSQVIRTRDP